MWSQLFILSALTLTSFSQQYPQSQPSSYNPAQFSSSQYRPSSQFSSAPQSAPQPYSPPQYSPSSSQYNPSASQYSPSSFTTPAPKIVHSPAQVHYVNIGADLAGDYKFGYDTGKGQTGQSFREETRLPDGTVRGAYGYVDPSGQQRIVRYTAGKEGFKVDSDSPSGAAAAAAPVSAPQQSYRPAPQSYSAPQSYNPAPQPSYNPAPQPAYNPASQPSYSSLPRAPASYAAPSSSLPARYSSGLSANSLGSSATRPEEENYGPPVINTALLNYNIGQRN